MPAKNIYSNTVVYQEVTIPMGESISPQVDCTQLSNGSGCGTLRSIAFPSNWTAGNLTFQKACLVNGVQTPFLPWYVNDGTGSSQLITVDGSQASIDTTFPPFFFDAVPYLIIRCAIAQATAATLILGFQPIYQGQA
jgi:hypothetical protein